MSAGSPAERYLAAQTARVHPLTSDFAAMQRFELDAFQIAGCHALEDGRSVLVAAPTGAGKTIIGEFAMHLAMLEPDTKAFYTTPMKALSNQKFRELVDIYGADEVGDDLTQARCVRFDRDLCRGIDVGEECQTLLFRMKGQQRRNLFHQIGGIEEA